MTDERIEELVIDAGRDSSGCFEYVISPDAAKRAIRIALEEQEQYDRDFQSAMDEYLTRHKDRIRAEAYKSLDLEALSEHCPSLLGAIEARVWREAALDLGYFFNLPDMIDHCKQKAEALEENAKRSDGGVAKQRDERGDD